MKVLLLIFTGLFLFSCTKEVKIDIPGYEEQIVIDGKIETGLPPFVILSNSKDIYAPTDLDAFLSGFIDDAEVIVSDGTTTVTLDKICSDNIPPGFEDMAAAFFGIPPSELANYHLCVYTSLNPSIFGKVGKNYALTVNYEGKSYTASTLIPQPTPLDYLFWKEEEEAPGYGFSWAHLTDPLGGTDAYKWEVQRVNKDLNADNIDPAFKTTYSPVFDDEFIDGKSFDFFYENPFTWGVDSIPAQYRGYYKYGDSVAVKFSKMDPYVYEFLEKKYIQLSTNGNPFASPTNIITNIKGGALGLWAGFSPSYDTLYCVP